MAYQDYHYIMDFVENMIKQLAYRICDTAHVPFGEHYIDLHQPFARMNAYEALLGYAPVSAEQLERDHIDATCEKHKVAIKESMSYTGKVFALFEEIAEPNLIQPTFIIDFPIEISPLSKRDKDDSSIAARFELYVAGMEISNGFNELNDPFDQAERFQEQAKALDAGEEESMHYDADYVRALEYGLPPTVGVGIGIDRLVMLMTNTQSIREVILFPTLRPKQA
jgi:lysyl-tRNA synthetase class 2